MATNAQEDDKDNIKELLKIYDEKIIPIGISAKGNTDEIVDIVSNYCWTAQQFDQRNTNSNSVTYSHNLPFCYAIERQQTIGSGAANILNSIIGGGQAMAGVSTEAFSALAETMKLFDPPATKTNGRQTQETQQGSATQSSISTNPVLIKSNTFPNIIMPAPGNGQSAQGNNEPMPIITTDSQYTAPPVGAPATVVEQTGAGITARAPGQTSEGAAAVQGSINNPTSPLPAGNGSDGDTSTASGSTATSKGGTESKDSGARSNTWAAMFKAFQSSTNTIFSALKVLGQDFANKVDGRLVESHLANSDYLKPWKWLYFTEPTKKKFVFPMMKANDLHKVTNQWGNGESSGKFAGFFDKINELLKQGSEVAKGIRDFAYFFPEAGESRSYENLEIEKAMGYQYSTQGGPEAKVEFVLYNTTQKDAWKKNFRFILLFALRNMAFRTSIYSYKAPLLYDVIIPGVKHLPLCYMASFDITALGHVRNMTTDNIIAEIAKAAASAQSIVPVPEAWQIGITFKCMIPNTANLILDLASFPINVTTANASLGWNIANGYVDASVAQDTPTNIWAEQKLGVDA